MMSTKDFFDLRNQLSADGYIKVGNFEADFGDAVKIVEQELFEALFKLQNCKEHQERYVICEMLRLLENAVDEVAKEAWRHAEVDFDAA
jgi:hypothetical protein